MSFTMCPKFDSDTFLQQEYQNSQPGQSDPETSLSLCVGFHFTL